MYYNSTTVYCPITYSSNNPGQDLGGAGPILLVLAPTQSTLPCTRTNTRMALPKRIATRFNLGYITVAI